MKPPKPEYEYSHKEIADIMHLSQKEVKQIEADALHKIKRAFKKMRL